MGISLDNFKSIFTCRTLLGSLALTGTCLACDHILQLPGVASSTYGRAVVDNFSHGMVGAMSWAMVVLVIPPCSLRQLAEVILCGLLASLLDVDHFIAARSFELKVKGPFFLPNCSEKRFYSVKISCRAQQILPQNGKSISLFEVHVHDPSSAINIPLG